MEGSSAGDRLEELIAMRENQLGRKPKELTVAADGAPKSGKVEALLNDVLQAIDNIPLDPMEAPVISNTLKPPVPTKPVSSGVVRLSKESSSLSIEPNVLSTFDKSVQVNVLYEDNEPNETEALESKRAPETEDVVPTEQTEMHTVPASEEIKPTTTHELTEMEASLILRSPDFNDFFNKASKLVERVLGQTTAGFDTLVDYSGEDGEMDLSGEVEKLKKLEVYHDNKMSSTRPVTCIRASPKFNELFLASYGEPDNISFSEPDGCVLVWSLPLSQRPEYIFTCQSAVGTALFDEYNPHIIIGGTYTGALVLWDTRAGAKPAQRTPLSPQGHCHPVYSMEIVGTQHAHNLISVDSDGRLCTWSLSMLVHPTDSITLKKGGRDLSVQCVAVADGETNMLYGGGDDGNICQVQIHGSRTGVTGSHEGHFGPVSAVHFHPSTEHNAEDFSDLLLSSSFDWTAKLWSPRNSSKPLISFENSEDYLYDVKWHPTHPGVFATANGEGFIDVWNLCHSFEIPIYRTQTSSRAINKLCWSKDGRRLITGEGAGGIQMWQATPELYQSRPDDFSKLAERLEDIKSHQ